MIFSFLVILKIFDIENVQNNHEWISECICGSFKSPNEYPNIFVVVLESEYEYIRWKLFEYPNVFEYSLRSVTYRKIFFD